MGMGYEEFKGKLKERIEKGLGMEASFRSMEGNNQARWEGLEIRGKGEAVAAILPVDEAYADYLGSGSLDGAVTAALYMLGRKEKVTVRERLMGWGEAKSLLHTEFVNYGWNRERLKGIPHRRVLDLAATYWVDMSKARGQSAWAQVSWETLKEWGITERELQEAAMECLRKESYPIQSMKEVMEGFFGIGHETKGIPEGMGEGLAGGIPDGMGFPGTLAKMEFVMSNEGKRYGAAGLLRADLLGEFAERLGDGFYILPSSIHELILLPCSIASLEVGEMRKMVREINEAEVIREEWLSENVYYYDWEKKEVRIAEP